MSEQKVTEQVIDTNDAILKAQSLWEKFGKKAAIALAVVAVIAGGFYAYKTFVVLPKEEKAAEIIYKAEQFFAADSSNKVLNGDGTTKGVLYVISNYGGTKVANLAHYYAGVSYLKLGNFAKAIEHLKDFSTDAKQVQMTAYGCLADAYAESGKKEEAIDYYKKASATFEKDEFNASEYLFRAALLSETLGKSSEAVELYKSLKEKFPKTEKGFQADKYINRLSVEKTEF